MSAGGALEVANPRPSLSGRRPFALFIALTATCSVMLYLRTADQFRLPQFFAEDGKYFFADAYNEGWGSLFNTTSGYFHLIPRLVANLSLSIGVPLVAIPAVFVYSCLALYAIVWHRIATRLCLPLMSRALMVLVTVLVPLGREIFMTMVNVQWVIALLPVVLYASEKPRSRTARLTDEILVFLCFLTGPYVVILCPIFAAHALLTGTFRSRRTMMSSGLLAFLATVWGLAQYGSVDRLPGYPSATSLYSFAELLSKTYLYPALGESVLLLPPLVTWIAALVILAGLFLLGRHAVRSGSTLALIALTLSVSLFALTGVAHWKNPSVPNPYSHGPRFFYLPAVLFLWALIALLPASRYTHLVWLAFCVNWAILGVFLAQTEESPFVDLDWPRYAAQLEYGGAVVVPLNPQNWYDREPTMTLRARPSG